MMGNFAIGALVGAAIAGIATAVCLAPSVEREHLGDGILGIARCDDGSYVAVMARLPRFVSTTATPGFFIPASLDDARIGFLPYPCGKPEGK